jgi:hypothetical protein
MKRFVPIIAALAFPGGLLAQERPPVLTESEEVALALSAAPANLTTDATVLVLRNDHYGVYRAGTNGVTCMVSRSRPLSLEPICYDPEASRTIMPMEKRRVELRLAGLGSDEIDRREAESIMAGEFRVPEKTAMAYMMSSGQVLYQDDTTSVGSWNPHLHVFSPYASAGQHGITGTPSMAAAMIAESGKPNASLIVVLREFVDPETGGTR